MTTPELSGLARTLLLTLRARADEHARPDALFADPVAADWIARLPWQKDYDSFYSTKIQNGFAIRARIFDDVTRQFLAGHPHPLIVELGAGLSTRRQRIGPGGAHWVELDLPEAIALRRLFDPETPDHRYLAYSMLDPVWMDQLPDVFPPTDMLFIAEGVLIFLDETGVKILIAEMRRRFPGAMFLLDVAGGAFRERTGPRLAAIDAPVRWFADDESEVAALGLAPQRVWPLLEQFPERWGKRRSSALPPDLRASGIMIEARIEPV